MNNIVQIIFHSIISYYGNPSSFIIRIQIRTFIRITLIFFLFSKINTSHEVRCVLMGHNTSSRVEFMLK